jgi:hypothetical protein
MNKYEVRPYERGGGVIIEAESGREIIRFDNRKQVGEACEFLNGDN